MTQIRIRPSKTPEISAIVSPLGDDTLSQHREDINPPLNPWYVVAFVALKADLNQSLSVAP